MYWELGNDNLGKLFGYFYSCIALSADPPILKDSIISCVGKVDDWRCLVGDLNGRVFMLFVESEERMNVDKAEVSGLRLELLGEVSMVQTWKSWWRVVSEWGGWEEKWRSQ